MKMKNPSFYCGHLLVMSKFKWRAPTAFFLKANNNLEVMLDEIEMYLHLHLKKSCLHETRLFKVRKQLKYLWSCQTRAQSSGQIFSLNHDSIELKGDRRRLQWIYATTRNFLKSFNCAVIFRYEGAYLILALKTMRSEVELTKKCPQLFQIKLLLWKMILVSTSSGKWGHWYVFCYL